MARDVEFNITAADKTGTALAAAERGFAKTGEKIKKQSEKTGDDSGKSIGKGLLAGLEKAAPNLAKNLSSEFGAIGASAGPILAVGLAASAPLIGAVMSGAIIGGAGIGGVLGGVILAAKDPRVAQAGQTLGKNLLGQLTQDADVFVGPVLQSIGTIEKAFDASGDHIKSIFSNSAKFVAPLTAGLTGLLSGVIRGVDALVRNAAPVIGAISNGLSGLGDALGDTFEDIASGSDGAARGIEDVFTVLNDVVRVTGPVLSGLSRVYEALDKVGIAGNLASTLLGPLGQVFHIFDNGANSAIRAAGATDKMGASALAASRSYLTFDGNLESATASADAMAKATHDLTDQNNSLYATTTDVANSMASASRKIKENGSTLSLNSEKGRANRGVLSDLAGSLRNNYDAYVKVNGVGPKSAALADTLRGKFIGLAEKAGYSAGKAKDLADKLLGIPASRNTKISVQAAKALEDAREVRRAIDSVHGKTVTVTVAVNAGALNKARLGKLGPQAGANFDASGSFAFAGAAGTSRVGGPNQVNVQNEISVNLNGAPFAAMTATAITRSERRQARRQKIGVRQ